MIRFLGLLVLAGCQTPADRLVRVEVPVPVPCLSSLPARPETTDDQALKAMDDYNAVLTMRRDTLVLRAHVDVLESLLAPCSQAGP